MKLTGGTKRHSSSLQEIYLISIVKKNIEWQVESQAQPQAQPNTSYSVKRLIESCECNMRCKQCNICKHSFTCTCLDSILHSTICKHIHLVVLRGRACRVQNEVCSENSSQFVPSQIKHPQTQDQSVRILKSTLHSLTSELQLYIKDCNEVNTLKVLKQRLNSDIGLLTALINTPPGQTSLTPTTSISPNTNNKTIYTTRKRRLKPANILSKPSMDEINSQRKKLKAEEPQFCGVCLKQNDKNKNDTIEWIQCTSCSMWLHTAFTTGTQEISGEYMYFYCS